jgi:4-amino-4-deoxy-L-arabinose transferase-like glycosyltransferase
MGIDISSFYIYRLRYYLGYGIIGLLLIGLLVFAGLYTPGGLSIQEMGSVVKSAGINFSHLNGLAITNLPYYLLQLASINLFGVNEFSLKLPSLVLALVSAISLILLLQRWFKPNIAVLASVIAITTGQFIFIAQDGTPGILYVLWSVLLLLLGTLIAKKVKLRMLWQILFFVVAALSLYTPLSIYALIALGIATVLHPHLRFIFRQLSKLKLVAAFVLSLIIILPLIIGILHTPNLGLTILGVPTSMPNILNNLMLLSQQYLGFATPSTTGLMTPVFGLGSMLIIAFGVYKLIRTRESTQSYLIIIWLICLIPILITNPGFTSVTFLPLVLLLATGLESLLGYWYRLFPRNPYARLAGLIPLVILVGVLVLSGLERYVYGYHYDPSTVSNFSQDLNLLPKNTKKLVVDSSELPFYNVVAAHRTGLKVMTFTTAGTDFTITHQVHEGGIVYPYANIERIITSASASNSDRFYVYKKVVE